MTKSLLYWISTKLNKKCLTHYCPTPPKGWAVLQKINHNYISLSIYFRPIFLSINSGLSNRKYLTEACCYSVTSIISRLVPCILNTNFTKFPALIDQSIAAGTNNPAMQFENYTIIHKHLYWVSSIWILLFKDLYKY